MGRSWKDVKKDKEALDRSNGRDVETAREHASALTQGFVLGDRLAQLREEQHLSQTEMAERLGVSQARVSKLEQGNLAHLELGTIRRYVAALGGTLKLVADFADHDVTVSTSQVDRSSMCA
ncbi:Helix-turn-helix domain-containing protein [Actinopolyspora mzabensis]|uniref:Helix-turn-helix domain-containing protein n=1 Tax=Actinopolyspora mzabensis TaxID=995066 RepID=A0A1G8WZW7_ACTMZ|nr:helix-turn-helix transcriptional regulator [Actinopolyspora mzabensis]SDJ83647.1 Helix-turn-helix domain-containing protein [Actinopolyspora mzabensis]